MNTWEQLIDFANGSAALVAWPKTGEVDLMTGPEYADLETEQVPDRVVLIEKE